jgi:hypothetical protein
VRSQRDPDPRPGALESVARAIAPTPDGNVLVAGGGHQGSGFALRTTASGRLDCTYGSDGEGSGFSAIPTRAAGDARSDGVFGVVAQPDGNYVGAGRGRGGGLVLGRIVGGPGAGAQAPAKRPLVRTLGARYLGKGRAVAYGVVVRNCASSTVRFVATPRGRGGGRTVTTRYAQVSGAYGPQVVCAFVRGLRPGHSYRLRLSSREAPALGRLRVLRAVPTGRRALPQEGCA